MLLKVSAHSSRELQAVIVALKGADKELRRRIRQETKPMAQTAWQQAVAEHASGSNLPRVSALVLARTARVAVSDQNVTLKSAGIGQALSGGLLPRRDWAAIEFGVANREEARGYEARRNGRSFHVKRRTRRQLPPRRRNGHVVYPAASEIIPRMLALWAQTAARTLHEAFEAGRG